MKRTKEERELTIWVDKKSFYFYQGEFVSCLGCKQILNNEFYYVRHWVGKKEYHFYCLCEKCLKDKIHKAIPIMFITITKVRYTTQISIDCELAIFTNPNDMVCAKDRVGELSTIDHAFVSEGKVIDKTRYADRQSLKGAKIGKEISEVVADSDKILSLKEGLMLLDMVANSIPLIEENKTKQIEQRKNENETED